LKVKEKGEIVKVVRKEQETMILSGVFVKHKVTTLLFMNNLGDKKINSERKYCCENEKL